MKICIQLLVLMAAVTGVALAEPVTWTFQDANFNDGGTITGSFVYDADTNAVSDWNVDATAGSFLGFTSGFTFTSADSTVLSASSTEINFESTATVPNPSLGGSSNIILAVDFDTALSDAGGTVTLQPGSPSSTAGTQESLNYYPYRLLDSGSVNGAATPTPEPASACLLAAGVLGLALAFSCRRCPEPA